MTDLSRLARQAASRSGFAASKVAAYQQAHGLDDTALAQQLGCALPDLTHLRLCMLPRPDHFQEDVERIAEHTHTDAAVLAQIIDPVEYLSLLLKERGFTGTRRNDEQHIIFQQGSKRLTIQLSLLRQQTAKQAEGIANHFVQECQGE